MQTLIIQKSTNQIVQTRYDTSTCEKMLIEQILNIFCESNDLNVDDYEVIEIPYRKFDFIVGKHIYLNGEIVVDPNWVRPPTVETASIPVSGT
jgi:hypothetical protein